MSGSHQTVSECTISQIASLESGKKRAISTLAAAKPILTGTLKRLSYSQVLTSIEDEVEEKYKPGRMRTSWIDNVCQLLTQAMSDVMMYVI